ncbi:MAG: sulfatase-like hydrolase/transferase [Planctomycetota bacterium]
MNRCLLCLGMFLVATIPSAATQPNILVLLADDMGYGDLGCMGSKGLRTPHLDALAASGVLCTQAYVASAVCSPSRAGLMTGRDPRRFGYEGNLNKGSNRYPTRPELLGLPPSEKTLGDHLGAAGYATALIGKWHLGTSSAFHPNSRGFDYFCGMLGGSHHYFPERVKHSIERNGEPVGSFSKPYLTDFFTDEAIGFIDRQPKDQPWFLFCSYNAPHGPMHATPEDLSQFEHIANEKRRTYAAMMFALDRGIGRLRSHLEKTQQWNNTLVVFFSDNGGATSNASWNGPLRGAKGCLREGGIRIPMIWSWPKKVRRGDRLETTVSSLDLLPTFLAAAGAEPLPLSEPMEHEDAKNRKRMVAAIGTHDGIDLLPQLVDGIQGPPRRLFWRLQGQAAVLDGNEKMIRLSHRPAQVYRVREDMGESADLGGSEPERKSELFEMLGEWESNLATVPLWDSSPFWAGQSAEHYDNWRTRDEPR